MEHCGACMPPRCAAAFVLIDGFASRLSRLLSSLLESHLPSHLPSRFESRLPRHRLSYLERLQVHSVEGAWPGDALHAPSGGVGRRFATLASALPWLKRKSPEVQLFKSLALNALECGKRSLELTRVCDAHQHRCVLAIIIFWPESNYTQPEHQYP